MTHLSRYLKKPIGWISSIIPQVLKQKTPSIVRWTAVGLLIRLLLMPLFAHQDFMTSLLSSFTLINRHQLIFSNDPPAAFFLLSGFYYCMMPLFPSSVLSFITSTTAFTPPTLLQSYSLLQPGIQTVLLLGKLPFLLFDMMSAFLMLRFFNDEKKSYFAFKLWILSPVSIFVSYMFGQFDIFPVFFIILALYFLKKNRFGWSMLSLGLASIFKIVGLALIPLVALCFWKAYKGKNSKTKIARLGGILVLGLIPLVSIPISFVVVPQYYESVNVALPLGTMFNGFFGSTFFTRGAVGQPFYSGLLSFLLDFSVFFRTQALIPDFVYFVPLAYALVILGAAYEKQLPFEKIIDYFAVFLLAYYAFSLFHPQWFLWVQPFLILLAAENWKVFGKLYALLMPLFFLYTWQWDSDLTTKLLAPITPQALNWAGPLTLMNDAGLPGDQIVSILRTIFSAALIFTIALILKTSFKMRTAERKNSVAELRTLNAEERHAGSK